MERTCMGCGGHLQNTDPKKPFYTPKKLEEAVDILCQRCFKMRHYNEVIPSYLSEADYQNIVSKIALEKALVVMVVDLFDLEGSMLPQIHKLTEYNDLIVIANKRDLLPKSVTDARLKHRVMKQLHVNQIKPLDVFLTSAIKRMDIDALIDQVFKYSKGRNIYIVGATNVGKSTLINTFLQASTAFKDTLITVSNTRGTTQGFIPIPFEDQILYDTPGLFNKNHLGHLLSEKSYQMIQPKKEIKPSIFQLKAGQTLWLTGLVRLDFNQGEEASFVIYMNNTLKVHRQKTENADEFYEKHKFTLLSPPTIDDQDISLKPHRFMTKHNVKTDLVIPGLGFITIKGKTTVTLHAPVGITPYQREAII
ncbi:ribosome biogenesis GTPase YqeH [Liberiplasma polymorphum]|uniref:ribosome biogenesis GTPase YqeH n=1 Tax=Liberiplasma polymorphum TaxID=3374570 RepID=UPI00377247CA